MFRTSNLQGDYKTREIRMVQAEIITIGDEILIGQIVDTNSAWLGENLSRLGVKVQRITSIGDTKGEIFDTLSSAIYKNRVTFVTGGIGPTKDDITKQTLAEIFNCELVKNEECYNAIEDLCRRKDLDFNELTQKQGYIPSCCTAITNNNGTAPAMIFERDGNYLISLPGVPFEMKSLCEDKIFPFLESKLSLQHNIHISKTIYGIPESTLAIKIAPWEDALPEYLHLAYLPSPSRIRLRLSAYGESSTNEIEEQFDKLKKYIPLNFIGDESESIEKSVARMLSERGETLSVAESCTGGSIAASFTAMAGASLYFLGGVVSYSNSMKTDILGVDTYNIEKYGAVSEEVVRQMAEGMRKLSGSTYAIATSGVAGPDGGTAEKPVGTVWMAVATPSQTIAIKKVFTKFREQNIEYATAKAISILRDLLI